jgi:hypothetical protein
MKIEWGILTKYVIISRKVNYNLIHNSKLLCSKNEIRQLKNNL